MGACESACPAISARTLISYKPSRTSTAEATLANNVLAAMRKQVKRVKAVKEVKEVTPLSLPSPP
jgi:hypothetical protein